MRCMTTHWIRQSFGHVPESFQRGLEDFGTKSVKVYLSMLKIKDVDGLQHFDILCAI